MADCCNKLTDLASFEVAFDVLGVLTDTNGFGNRTAQVGLTAVNGTASTAARSDSAAALSQSIAPTWTGKHIHRLTTEPQVEIGYDASNFMSIRVPSNGRPQIQSSEPLTGTPTDTFMEWGNSGVGNSFNAVMRLRNNGQLRLNHGAGFQTVPLQSTDHTWTGANTFNQRTTHVNGISLSTSGVIQSAEVDAGGQSGFTLDLTTTRATDPTFLLQNSADSKQLIKVLAKGQVAFGYTASLVADTGAVLGFNAKSSDNDTWSRAILATMTHDSGTLNPGQLQGIGGVAWWNNSGTTAPGVIVGLHGAARSERDVTGLGSVELCGVTGQPGESSNVANNSFDYAGRIDGNFRRVSAFRGPYYRYSAKPTNLPVIGTGATLEIPAVGITEQWALETMASDTGMSAAKDTPAVGGAAKFVFPVRGTRRTHLYFVPNSLSGLSGNVVGDVIFASGASKVEGLYEHDGTALRKLVPQTAHTTTGGTNPPALGGPNVPGTGAANHVGWITVKIDDGTAGGRTGLIPYWQ